MTVNVFIPTLNAGKRWSEVIENLRSQSYPVSEVVIVDSGSKDETLSEKFTQGFKIIAIDKKDFDHGGTRQMAVGQFPDADIYLFITQDAILANTRAVEIMVEAFKRNPRLGMVFGRQLPHKGAKELESHARLF